MGEKDDTMTWLMVGAAGWLAYWWWTNYGVAVTTTTTPAVALGSSLANLQASMLQLAGTPVTTPMNVDQWNTYYNQLQPVLTSAQVTAIDAVVGGDQSAPILIGTYLAAIQSSGVNPGLSGGRRLRPALAWGA